jgi:hypothetical protein
MHIPSVAYIANVRLSMIAPVLAAPGEILVVVPSDRIRTIVVWNCTGTKELRSVAVSPGALYGMLLVLDADGVIDLQLLNQAALRAIVAA